MECSYTQEIICPYCGYEFSDNWTIYYDNDETQLIDCLDCGKEFYCTKNIEISYSSQPATYGNCLGCGKMNTVIEDYHSRAGSYEGLCVDCGEQEKRKLMGCYFNSLDAQTK